MNPVHCVKANAEESNIEAASRMESERESRLKPQKRFASN